MGRKKRADAPDIKVSVLLGQDLHRQVDQIRVHRRVDPSAVLRELIEMGMEAEQPKQQGVPPGVTPGSHTSEGQGQGITIALTDELRACLDLAAKLHGMAPEPLVQTMLSQGTGACIEQGRQRQAEFRRLVGEGKDEK